MILRKAVESVSCSVSPISVRHSHPNFSFVFGRLLTPPGTPLFPSLEMESHRTMMSQSGDSKGRPASLTSRVIMLFLTLLTSFSFIKPWILD